MGTMNIPVHAWVELPLSIVSMVVVILLQSEAAAPNGNTLI